MSHALDHLALPTDPIKQKQFKLMVNQVLNSMQKIDQETEAKKEAIAEIVHQFSLPAKVISKLVRVLHKANYTDIQKENEIIELLHETVVKGSTTSEND